MVLSIKLIVAMDLFFKIRSVKNHHLAAPGAEIIGVPQRLRDDGF
jgi:hypothetical protein